MMSNAHDIFISRVFSLYYRFNKNSAVDQKRVHALYRHADAFGWDSINIHQLLLPAHSFHLNDKSTLHEHCSVMKN